MHTKRLMVNFESDEAEQERRIETTTAAITQIFRHAEQILKKFGSTNNSAISKAELSVRTNLQRNLAKKLQGLSLSFRTSQKVMYVYVYMYVLIMYTNYIGSLCRVV